MADARRPATPPRAPTSNSTAITPEQVRRMEESRLRAKALRSQQHTTATTGQKRPHSALTSTTPAAPSTTRDARATPSTTRDARDTSSAAPDTDIRAARKFQKFVEYDFSQMTDTKGGFLTATDDPHNRALHAPEAAGKPAHLTLQEWERQQLQRRLRETRSGPYEPGLSVLDKREITKKCRECGSLELDWQWDEVLHCQICYACKEKFPEKYSLLTKTEAKEDYLLTDPELRDEALLPRLEKANPHQSSWKPMMLFLRFQVEDYAFGSGKWGSAEALDEEFERRRVEGRERKEKKFKNKLEELKKRTRVEAYKRGRRGGGGEFGDTIGRARHEHEWGRGTEDPVTGAVKKSCVECGMEVEELEF